MSAHGCARREATRKKGDQDRISGNVAKWAGGQVGNHADNGGKARQLMAVRIPSNETTGMTCRIMDIETGIRFRANGRKETAPQVIAEKITHRLIDGEKEESFAVRLSRAGDEENHGDKNIAKGDDRLSDGTMDEKEKSPALRGERERRSRLPCTPLPYCL